MPDSIMPVLTLEVPLKQPDGGRRTVVCRPLQLKAAFPSTVMFQCSFKMEAGAKLHWPLLLKGDGFTFLVMAEIKPSVAMTAVLEKDLPSMYQKWALEVERWFSS